MLVINAYVIFVAYITSKHRVNLSYLPKIINMSNKNTFVTDKLINIPEQYQKFYLLSIYISIYSNNIMIIGSIFTCPFHYYYMVISKNNYYSFRN